MYSVSYFKFTSVKYRHKTKQAVVSSRQVLVLVFVPEVSVRSWFLVTSHSTFPLSRLSRHPVSTLSPSLSPLFQPTCPSVHLHRSFLMQPSVSSLLTFRLLLKGLGVKRIDSHPPLPLVTNCRDIIRNWHSSLFVLPNDTRSRTDPPDSSLSVFPFLQVNQRNTSYVRTRKTSAGRERRTGLTVENLLTLWQVYWKSRLVRTRRVLIVWY